MVDTQDEPTVVVGDDGRRLVSWLLHLADGPVTFQHDYPDAVQHHYQPGGMDSDLWLYEGAFSVDGGDEYVGKVRWRWGRRPHIEAQGSRPFTSADLRNLSASTGGVWAGAPTLGIELPEGALPAQPATPAVATAETHPSERPVSSSSVNPRVEQELGAGIALEHVTFLVPNGWDGQDGTGICDPDDLTHLWKGRTEAAGGGWQVTLDRHAEINLDAWRELKDVGGCRFTHVGRLSRTDGSMFTGKEAFAALDRVRLGLNLALGRRTTCALPVGWRDGKPVWCRWRSAQIDAYRSLGSVSHWLDDTVAHRQVRDAVSLMLDFTADEGNLAAVRPALAYYVAGNVDVDVELSVAVPLSALQLLSYYRFVEQRQVYSRTQWENKATEEQIRLLIDDLLIDTNIAPQFQHLAAVRDRLALTATTPRDALGVVVKMRNVVTHPTRDRPSTFGVYEWAEAGMHVRYWLCLALLHAIGYRGMVAAIHQESPRWTGQLRTPPWVS